jgi:hypothetical protein
MAENILKIEGQSTANIVKWIVVAGIGIVGLALAIKMIRKAGHDRSADSAIDDENVKMAMELNTALHPSRNWFGNMFTGADKDKIFQIASSIKKFNDVSAEYRNLYKEDLAIELQDALGDEYPALMDLLKETNISSTSAMPIVDITNLAVRLRNEIEGLSWTSRDLKPFSDLMRLSDENFNKVVDTYNSKYNPDNFRDDMKSESSVSALTGLGLFGGTGSMDFDVIKKKILARIG